MYSQRHAKKGIGNGIYTLRYSIPVIFSEHDLSKRDIIEREISLNELGHENSVYLLILQNGVKIGEKMHVNDISTRHSVTFLEQG